MVSVLLCLLCTQYTSTVVCEISVFAIITFCPLSLLYQLAIEPLRPSTMNACRCGKGLLPRSFQQRTIAGFLAVDLNYSYCSIVVKYYHIILVEVWWLLSLSYVLQYVWIGIWHCNAMMRATIALYNSQATRPGVLMTFMYSEVYIKKKKSGLLLALNESSHTVRS